MGDVSKKDYFDFLFDAAQGVDMGQNPSFLANNALAFGANLTVRGAFPKTRPAFRKLTLSFPDADTQTAFTKGLFQERAYYKPDSGPEALTAAISGRMYEIFPNGAAATVTDVTGGNPQDSTVLQHWQWQAENYVFWNDGVNLPVFFDGTTTTRSAGPPAPPPATHFVVKFPFSFPAGYDGTKTVPDTISFTLTTNFAGANGDTVILGQGSVTPLDGVITAGAGTPNVTGHFNLKNASPNPFFVGGGTNLVDTVLYTQPNPQFDVGRQGTYGMGRVCMIMADGKQFVFGDIVGGPSGSKALQFRDAILNITENNYLTGGGTFTVPGSIGDVRSLRFAATLDAALGQGPLQIFTPVSAFSCNTPVERLTWQIVTNPILTQSLIANGAQAQNSTILINGDIWFRALDGIRSLKLARQEFQVSWSNTPASREVQPILDADDQGLLRYGSAVFFDNRLLMTSGPVSTTQGVYHKGLIALNFDSISTLHGKLPPVYDGLWTGLNILSVVEGIFSGVQRCYIFALNTAFGEIELWELLTTADTTMFQDNNQLPISWVFESAGLFDSDQKVPAERKLKQLMNGEIYIKDLKGTVNFQVLYKPDDYPCFVPWYAWSECEDVTTVGSQPGFRPRMGLGQPDPYNCDTSTNRPLRQGFSFQVRVVITGSCTFMGARFQAVELPQPLFAPQSGC